MIPNENVGNNLIANQYKVFNMITGGMGKVFFCFDVFNENNPVALKTIKPEFLSDLKSRNFFLREASIWIDIGYHPNIVQALKVLHLPDDQSVFIVMQYIPTQPGFSTPSLRELLNLSGNLSEYQSTEIMLGIIRGMMFAETKFDNLVHRDLKPENILLGLDGQPKITDFGIALSISKKDEAQSLSMLSPYEQRRSQVDIMGTPFYMSPEQWLGQELDRRSDIYALGCIFFEMLTGQRIISSNNQNEVFKAHISGQAIKKIVSSKIPSLQKDILMKCLNIHTEERFQTWQDLYSQVLGLLSEDKRDRFLNQEYPLDVGILGKYQKTESYLSIGAAYINLGEFENGRKYCNKAQIISDQQGFPLLHAVAMSNQGVAFSEQGFYRQAIECYEEAILFFEKLGEIRHVCQNIGNIGNAYFGLLDLQNSKQYLSHACQLSQELPDFLNLARWTANLGNVYLASGDYITSLQLFQSALKVSQNTKDLGSICKHLANIGTAFESLNQLDEAMKYYESALQKAKEICDRPTEGNLYLAIGSLYCKLLKGKKGIESFRLGLEIAQECNSIPMIAKALGNLGAALMQERQIEAAKPILLEALSVSKRIESKDIKAKVYWSLGILAEMEGDFINAINHLRNAIVIFKELNMVEYEPASKHLLDLRKTLGLL